MHAQLGCVGGCCADAQLGFEVFGVWPCMSGISAGWQVHSCWVLAVVQLMRRVYWLSALESVWLVIVVCPEHVMCIGCETAYYVCVCVVACSLVLST